MPDMTPTPKKTPSREKIKVLLLENIHRLATEAFEEAGYEVESLPHVLKPAQMVEKIRDAKIVAIRSKTTVTPEVLAAGKKLISVGCFCIGTNQVDLAQARKLGVAVFNAPFGNTRSVAEMVLGEIIMLSRGLGQRSMEVHKGEWKKISTGCYEVRGKTLGIVGYGNIGTQISALAETLGMRVMFYDVVGKLPYGNAHACHSIDDLLKNSHFVTLHVPVTAQTI